MKNSYPFFPSFLCSFLNDHEEARAAEEQAMQQVRALQEMVRNQPAASSNDMLDSVEMKVLQRNLDATQAELKQTEGRLNQILQEKTKLEQNLFRSHQDYKDLQQSIEARVKTQGEALKIELDMVRAELETTKQAVDCEREQMKRRKKRWNRRPKS